MIPFGFDYAAPTSIEEALRQLRERPDDAKLLAGGHSLIPVMKLRLAAPALLVDLSRVPGLTGIRVQGEGLAIGAMTTHAELAASADLLRIAPALAQAAGQIGDRQVRSRGTIGGSLAHADPAADMPAVVLALGATLVLRSLDGERSVAADDFFTGLFETALRPDELLTEVRIPASSRSVYEKHRNPASGYAIVGVSAAAQNGGVRIGVTGATASAFRATAAERALGGALNAETIGRASAAAGQGQDFLDDLHGSAAYRGHLVQVLTKRALNRLAAV